MNLCVAPGEFVYLIGRVGSGKSTLLKTLYAEVQLLSLIHISATNCEGPLRRHPFCKQ